MIVMMGSVENAQHARVVVVHKREEKEKAEEREHEGKGREGKGREREERLEGKGKKKEGRGEGRKKEKEGRKKGRAWHGTAWQGRRRRAAAERGRQGQGQGGRRQEGGEHTYYDQVQAELYTRFMIHTVLRTCTYVHMYMYLYFVYVRTQRSIRTVYEGTQYIYIRVDSTHVYARVPSCARYYVHVGTFSISRTHSLPASSLSLIVHL